MSVQPNQKYTYIALGASLLTVMICLLIVVSRPGKKDETKSPPPKSLAKGTPIKLLLVDDLTSGGSKEGETVRFVLNTDLGRSNLPGIGGVVTGKVTWSRSEGTLGGLTNNPARLNVSLDPFGPYQLSAHEVDKKDIEFNRDNTGLLASSGEEMTPERVELLEDLLTGKSTDEISKDLVENLKADAALPETQKFLAKAPYVNQGSLIAALASGGTVAEFGVALSALNEIRGVLGRNLGKLKRTLSGRNIHAYPGTEVTVYVWKPTP